MSGGMLTLAVSAASLAISLYSAITSWRARLAADDAWVRAYDAPKASPSLPREEIELRLAILQVVAAGANAGHLESALALWRFTHGRLQVDTKTQEG